MTAIMLLCDRLGSIFNLTGHIEDAVSLPELV
jgi:hypothetical protein